ncbi:MAG TPA: hypothetical protein VMS94_06825 [Acidobacteriota bacterium]|nr:hypothetical protein [Acidobacteriota bacterium]
MKIPLEIHRIRDPDGASRFRAIVSFQDAIANTSQSQKLIRIQKEYAVLVSNGQRLLKEIRRNKKNMADSQLQWSLADKIYSFVKRIENDGYVFANVSEALTRDVGLSQSQLNYLVKFRTYYPSIDLVHKEINWSKYREILDMRSSELRRICENKILAGEIKTDYDVRMFKRTNRKTK